MLLEPDPPMPLDEALRLAKIAISPGAPIMLGARAVRALCDYIEVLEGQRAAPVRTLAAARADWGPPPPVERIEVGR
jgi:hypothetical protein